MCLWTIHLNESGVGLCFGALGLDGGDCTSSADAECFGSNWALQVYPRGFATTYDDAGCLATYGEFNRMPLIKVTSSSKDSTKVVKSLILGKGKYLADSNAD